MTVTATPIPAPIPAALARPGEPGYQLATPWNMAVPVRPAAVVPVRSADDVARAVRYAAEQGLRVAVQRTGHGALPVGEDTLLVHTGGLDELRVDPLRRRARVGAGVLWRQVGDAAAAHGLAPLAGSAPGVGVVGMLTGGGIGPLSRTHGLAADRVTAFELVTGEGRQLRVTAQEHPDLFWGLRGGKGALGIVTAVELDLLPVAEIHGGTVYFDGSDAAAVLHAWRAWSAGLPEHANTSVALLQLPDRPTVPPPLAGRLTVAVRFTSTAGDDEAARVLAPIRAAATPLIDTVTRMPTAAIGSVHADPVDPMPVHDGSTLLRELPADSVDALLALAGPGSGSPQAVVELRRLGGALSRPGAHPSAYDHRDAAYHLFVVGVLAPPVAAAVPAHTAAVLAALRPAATGAVLANFASAADRGLSPVCYRPQTLARLSALAARHDPAGVLAARTRPA